MKNSTNIQPNFKMILAIVLFISQSLIACTPGESGDKIDIHAAVATNNIDDIKAYIGQGNDINIKDPFGGSSPLITAALYDRHEVAQLLIKNGADINQTNNEGSTALHTAAFFCRTEIVELLIQKGADQSIVNNYGATPLMSVSGSYEDIMSVYEMMKQQLSPIGVQLDLGRIKATRPQVAQLLSTK